MLLFTPLKSTAGPGDNIKVKAWVQMVISNIKCQLAVKLFQM